MRNPTTELTLLTDSIQSRAKPRFLEPSLKSPNRIPNLTKSLHNTFFPETLHNPHGVHSPCCNKSMNLILSDYRCVPGGLSLQGIDNVNWYNYYEKFWAISTKAENMHVQWPPNFNPRYKPSRNKYLCAPPKMYKNVHSSIIHTHTKKLERTQSSSIIEKIK